MKSTSTKRKTTKSNLEWCSSAIAQRRVLVSLVVIALAVCVTPALADDDQLPLAKAIAKKLVVDFLTEKAPFAVTGEGASGTGTPIEPSKKALVEIVELTLGFQGATTVMNVTAPMRFKGKVTEGEQESPVSGVLDLKFRVEAAAEVRQIGEKAKVVANVTDLKAEAKEVRELEAEDKAAAEEALKKLVRDNSAEFQRQLNEWLVDKAVDPNKVDEEKSRAAEAPIP